MYRFAFAQNAIQIILLLAKKHSLKRMIVYCRGLIISRHAFEHFLNVVAHANNE